jgi:5-methylcytosine-specific restriction endonuclease McrA
MKHVSSNTTTTLVLDGSYQPIGFFSARSAIQHLITGRGMAYDKYGNLQSWEQWINTDHDKDQYDYLCTPSMTIIIPSIMVITHHFGNLNKSRQRIGKDTSLRHLYKVYKGVCQYCLEKIQFNKATKDHIYPKSKGGLTSSCNLVLSCTSCNSKKANIFPYYNKEGNLVKPITLLPIHRNILYMPEMREEWQFFLYQK